jgi:hypothetical protein
MKRIRKMTPFAGNKANEDSLTRVRIYVFEGFFKEMDSL